MRRVRQESAEVYEVTPVEVAIALGLYLCEGDEVTIEHQYGDKFKLTVRTHEDESFDIPVPIPDVLGDFGPVEIPLVMIPPPLPPLAPDALAVEAYAPYPGEAVA
jgi:hypothetical protein